jgi:hypothetical protein
MILNDTEKLRVKQFDQLLGRSPIAVPGLLQQRLPVDTGRSPVGPAR